MEHSSRFGIDAEADYRYEDLGLGTDDLWTGDVNLVFRFAQSETVQMRSGIGVGWLSDQLGTEAGFNFTYGGDWTPADPWIFSADIDWGRLGETSVFHGRATAGVKYHRLEIYTGYDYYDLGDTAINGLIGGVRLWF